MKCCVVRDLLPEYEEGMCSEETKQEIMEHLAGCEACRGLYEALKERDGQEEDEAANENLNQIQPFEKISRRLRRLKTRNVVVSAALAVVCVIVGIMTFFQFFPELNGISFDRIKYYQRAKEITRSFAGGDMETFLQGMLYGLDTGGNLNLSMYTHTEDFYTDALEELNTLYEECLAGKNVKIKVEDVRYYGGQETSVSSYYDESVDSHRCGYKAWTKIIVGDIYINLDIYMYNDDGYGVYVAAVGNDESGMDSDFLSAVSRCVDYVNYFQDIIGNSGNASWWIGNTQMWNSANEAAHQTLAEMFAQDCTLPDTDGAFTEQLMGQISALMQSVTADEATMTNTGYDSAEKKVTAILFWSFTDSEGHSGILQKNFYYGPYGYEAVNEAALLLCGEGMSEELKEQVRALFD